MSKTVKGRGFPCVAACGLLVVAASAAAAHVSIDSRAYIEKSVALIEAGQQELARTYLAPALIDHRISASERSRAYYLRGYSFFAQELYVSASKDYRRALEFNADNPGALAALATLHLRGLGVDLDPELAYQLYLKAAHAGHIGAQFHVGYQELEGLGTEQDPASARRWLEGAAAQGHRAAMMHLARSLRAEFADEPDPQQAKAWYDKAYAAGATDALVGLAYMYQAGELGEPDAARAAELFRQAAAEGSAAGQVSLGHLYLTGKTVATDYAEARRLFEQAAAQRLPSSYVGLGHLYEHGLGVKQDLAAARKWYRLGARAGETSAQLRLARVLFLTDAPEQQQEAMSWLARAANQGDPRAQNDYAWMLATHKNPSLRDGELALAHAQRAVESEPSAAHLDTLAAAYAETSNFDEAITAQQRALSTLGDDEADLRDELTAHLNAYEGGKPWRE